MKVSINQKAKEFESFDLVIKIETEREREFLIAFFNASPFAKAKLANDNKLTGMKDFSVHEKLFEEDRQLFYTLKSTI